MRSTVLGGQRAYPTSGHGCSGYLLEHDGFRLLIDPGYATAMCPRTPGTDPDESAHAAAEAYAGPIAVARPRMVVDLSA